MINRRKKAGFKNLPCEAVECVDIFKGKVFKSVFELFVATFLLLFQSASLDVLKSFLQSPFLKTVFLCSFIGDFARYVSFPKSSFLPLQIDISQDVKNAVHGHEDS